METIRYGAFSGCGNLVSAVFPTSIRTVGEKAFLGSGVELVYINPTRIYKEEGRGAEFGYQAFESCANLKKVVIEPQSVSSLPGCMFKWCGKLADVTLPEGLTSIGGSAFDSCTALEGIRLPNSLLSLDVGVFGGCSALREIAIPDKVRAVPSFAFRDCGALETVVLGEQAASISEGAFRNCGSLHNLTLYYHVTAIADSVFHSTPLRNVTYYGAREEWDALCGRVRYNEGLTNAGQPFGAKLEIIPIVHTRLTWRDDSVESVADAAQRRVPLTVEVERGGIARPTPVTAMAAVYGQEGRLLGVYSCTVDENGSLGIDLPAGAVTIKILVVEETANRPLLPARRFT